MNEENKLKMFFTTWTIHETGGKVKVGSDIIAASDEENATKIQLAKNAKLNINTTNVKVYKLSELLEKYNIRWSLPEPETKKIIKPKPIEHREATSEEILEF